MDRYKEELEEVAMILMQPEVNSFNRMCRFLSIKDELSDVQYWYGLQFAYQGSDNMYGVREEVKEAFMSDRPYREYLMTPEQREHLYELPELVNVYRGMTVDEYQSGEFGVSWTLRKSVAEFFAYDYIRNVDTREQEKTVIRAGITKYDILCYWDDRDEDEVIVLPHALWDIKEITQ